MGPGRGEWAALVLFAGVAGAVDVLAFTALGRVFAGVMTGNLVLLGLALTRAGGDSGLSAPLLALAGYVVGAVVVGRFCRRLPGEPESRWPAAVVRWLAVEAALLAAVTVGWAVAGGAPGQPWRDVVLTVLAAAMGVQSAALVGAGRAGGPGTYFTGTLTTLAVRAAGPDAGRPALGDVLRLIALTSGAAAAAGVRAASPAWAMAVPLFGAVAALVCVTARGRRP